MTLKTKFSDPKLYTVLLLIRIVSKEEKSQILHEKKIERCFKEIYKCDEHKGMYNCNH